MVRSDSKNLLELKFDNISDFERYLDKNKNSENTESLHYTRKSFTGVENWSEFETYLEDGNKEMTDDVRKYTKAYINQFEEHLATSIEYQFDVTGQFFDIGAVMVGEPESWIKEIEVKEDKFIELNVQGTYAHNADIDKVKKNGSKVLALATVLESKGFLVRINMNYRTYDSNMDNYEKRTNFSLMVKDYNHGLDYKKFGILLGVPFFRCGIFRALEIEYGYRLSSGYGKAVNEAGEINLDTNKAVEDLERRITNEH